MPAATRIGTFALFSSTLLLAACVSTTFRPSKGAPTAFQGPVAPEQVLVLRSFPNEPFVLLGEIEAHLSGHHEDEAIIRKARKKAASIGADAIVYESEGLQVRVHSAGEDGGYHRSNRASVRFNAIRFVPKSPPV